MKKLLTFLVKFLLIGIFLGLGAFLALALYYRSNFSVNTWINGIYCTGKTVEQVNEELVSRQEASVIYIVDANRTYWEIDMQAAEVQPDYTLALEKYLQENAGFFWLNNLQESVSSQLDVERYVFDEARLLESFGELPFVKEEQAREAGVEVCHGEEGYYLRDGNAQRLDPEKAFEYLTGCLSKGQTTVLLWEGDCYEDIPDSAKDKVQREIWTQVCEFTDCRLVYDMGAELIAFTPRITGQFLETDSESGSLLLDARGKIMVSEKAVQQWVEQLAADYDTLDTEREFETTAGNVVTVKYGTYGTKLDVEAETEYLLEALRTGRSETEVHVPVYEQEGFARGLDDIGDTYIEIDMTAQKMYYYAQGELMFETDVVTGDMDGRMGTPEGINYVYNKQRNRTLRGPGYASFVKYWMPVNGGIGIHDAGWRSRFGGEIYKTNGSHGCINTPPEIMDDIYEAVEIGTPVIMFY